ncbi:MAG: response regulator [Magnetococcales bacterium]|nr:response regulator [Magnetococcales bacterium]
MHDMIDLPCVLIVDDDIASMYIYELFLDKYCRIDLAYNGVEALEKMRNHSYEMIIMDIKMPEMDGLTAIKHFRVWEQQNNVKKTYIVVITALAFNHDRQRSYSAGCDLFLTKPVNRSSILKALRICTCQTLSSSVLHKQYCDRGGIVVPDENFLDLAYLKNLYNLLGEDRFAKLLRTAYSSGQELLESLYDFFGRSDFIGFSEANYRFGDMAIHVGMTGVNMLSKSINITNETGEEYICNLRDLFAFSLDSIKIEIEINQM